MKVLITGVAGLLGAHYAKYLLDKGYEVIGIDNLSGGYKEFVDERVTFYKDDLNDVGRIDTIFGFEKPDYVYHFAAYAAEGLSHYIRNFNYTNNIICSVNVINACVKYNVKKIIFTSSMATYGSNSTPFEETMTPRPEDPYGVAKYAVEMDLKTAYDQFGLEYNIIRPHNVIGIYQNIWDRYRNVIGIWIRKVIDNEPITIFGDGSQVRAFSDIKFYMEPFERLMKIKSGEIFNLGADKECTILKAAETVKFIGEEFGFMPTIVHLEKRNEVHTAYCSHHKAKFDLKFRDMTDFDETVRQMFKWALTQPDRVVHNQPYEIDKNLYSYWR
tara:strand:+ start:29542 stop:30528 length:987 start_codon:yes stop_codon:yes gene_type:complete